MGNHLRFTLRSLFRTPSFTIAAWLCLALGIGATTSIFSIVNAVLLRPLPYHNPEQLVRLYTEFPTFPHGGLRRFWVSPPEFVELQQSPSFQAIGSWAINGVNLSGNGEAPVRISNASVTGQVLPLLQVKPLIGRVINDDDAKPGAPPVIVLSHGLWQRAYGADPKIVGHTVYIDSVKTTVIGVMPPTFIFPPGELTQSEAWTPFQMDFAHGSPSSHFLSVFGRLRDGVSLSAARDNIGQMVAHWGEAESENHHVLNPKDHPVVMYPFYGEVVGGIRKTMFLLLGAVGFVLLIACTNVANLLLARSESRQREIAIRRAIGASTGHLLKQFLSEGIILSLVGAALGVALSYGAVRLIALTNAGSIPRADEISVDWRVLVFALLIALFTGIIFAFTPLIQVSAVRVYETLKGAASRTSTSSGSNQFRRILIVAQVTMAFVLLAGASLMIRGFRKLQEVHSGIEPRNILTFEISLPRSTYNTPEKAKIFWHSLLAKLNESPGVQSAAVLQGMPPIRPVNENTTDIEGFHPLPGGQGPTNSITYYQVVSPEFFKTFGIHLLQGRFMEDRDGQPTTPGVMINETMARTFWPGQNPIGKHIRPMAAGSPQFAVVGVIADIKNGGLDRPAGTEAFFHYQLAPFRFGLGDACIALKTTGDPNSMLGTARTAVNDVDSTLPLAHVKSMEEVMDDANSRPRFLTLVLTAFSTLALLLAAVGIYGVISYSVAQRTTEFGVRMALGAQPGQLLRQVLIQGLVLGLAGIAAGTLCALLLTQSLEGLMFGVSTLDLSSVVVTALVLTAATLVACFLPAFRAMRTEPLKALHYE